MRATDVVDLDYGLIYITDDVLDDQLDTLPLAGGRLQPGLGALRIITIAERGLARVTVDMREPGGRPEPVAELEGSEECIYRTELGVQRVRGWELEECQGDLADPFTPPGPAIVHVRVYTVPGPHEPSSLGVPIIEHVLLQIWNEQNAFDRRDAHACVVAAPSAGPSPEPPGSPTDSQESGGHDHSGTDGSGRTGSPVQQGTTLIDSCLNASAPEPGIFGCAGLYRGDVPIPPLE